MSYKYNKKWRLLHTKLRNEGRKRYYTQFRDNERSNHKWNFIEAGLILVPKLSDRFLHDVLGRSVQAIQVKRCELMKGG